MTGTANADRVVRVGTRRSKLARAQTTTIRNMIEAACGLATEEVLVTSHGDVDRTRPLAAMTHDGPGVFTRALEAALRDGTIDVAVHSLKDMPLATPEDLPIVAVPLRADARDTLVVRADAFDPDAGVLPVKPGARVGTSSPRRQALLVHHAPEAIPTDVRGNVETRLGLVTLNVVDAVILARAGLDRGQFKIPDGCRAVDLPLDAWPAAPAQGALAVQVREGDVALAHALDALDDPLTRAAASAERALLGALGGGCGLPLGASAEARDGVWQLHAAHAANDWWTEGHLDLRTVSLFGRTPGGVMAYRAREALAEPAEPEEDGPPPRLVDARVLLTFDPDQAAPYVRHLEAEGATAAAWPLTAHDALPVDPLPDAIAEAAPGAQWVVVTSHRGVPGAAALHGVAKEARWAAVGPGTARAMRAAGLPVHLVAPEGTAASLAEAIAGWKKPEGPVLAPGAEAPRPELAEGLEAAGFRVVPWPVYRTRALERVPDAPLAGPVDALVVTAPSAARALPADVPARRVIALGPSTAKALSERGVDVAAIAPRRTPGGVLEALLS